MAARKKTTPRPPQNDDLSKQLLELLAEIAQELRTSREAQENLLIEMQQFRLDLVDLARPVRTAQAAGAVVSTLGRVLRGGRPR